MLFRHRVQSQHLKLKGHVEQHVTTRGGTERIYTIMVGNLSHLLVEWWETSLVKTIIQMAGRSREIASHCTHKHILSKAPIRGRETKHEL